MIELEYIDYMTDKIFGFEGELTHKHINSWTYEWLDDHQELDITTFEQIKRDKISAFVTVWEAVRPDRDWTNYIEGDD